MSKLPSYSYIAVFQGLDDYGNVVREDDKIFHPPGGRGSRYTPEQIWREVREYSRHMDWATKIEVIETESKSVEVPEPNPPSICQKCGEKTATLKFQFGMKVCDSCLDINESFQGVKP